MAETTHQDGRRFSIPLKDGGMSGLRWGPDGPPDLVFLHANGFNAATYRPLLAPLGERYRVVALDLRGHGLSTLPADPARMTNWNSYADDLVEALALLTPQGHRPPVLAGHSMGSVTALLAAARNPGLARSLVLLDPVLMHPLMWLYARTPPGRAKMRRTDLAIASAKRRSVFPSKEEAVVAYHGRKAFASWQPGFLEGYVDGGFVADGEGVRLACAPAWESANFATQTQNSWRALKRVKVPVSILAGGIRSTVYGGPARLNRVVPHVAVESLPGTSHFFPMEKPDHVREALSAALART